MLFFVVFVVVVEMAYFRSTLGHIDDHMPAPDSTCGARTHDSWVLRYGLLTTAPSMPTRPLCVKAAPNSN